MALVVVVATRNSAALAALEQAATTLKMTRREALTTAGLGQALPGAHLVIVDLEDLTESPTMPHTRLAQILANTATVNGAAFAADPQTHLDRARAASGLREMLPARAVAFTSLAGGVGKTTLALSLARYFRRRTGLPTAVVELSPGPSGLLALADKGESPHLYEVITQGKEWPLWEGILLAPMDWGSARLLDKETVEDAWRELCQQYVLTIFDAPAWHPLWPPARCLADRAFAVTDGRPDALAGAMYLAEQYDERGGTEVLLNRGGVAARLTLTPAPAAILPDVGRAASRFPNRLGQRLMRLVYPGWTG